MSFQPTIALSIPDHERTKNICHGVFLYEGLLKILQNMQRWCENNTNQYATDINKTQSITLFNTFNQV